MRAYALALLLLTSPASAQSASPMTDLSGLTSGTVQKTTVLTDSSGVWTVTFAHSFISPTPVINAIPVNAGAASPMDCNVTTRSATAATGKCWMNATTAVALISLTVSIGPTAPPTATPIMIVAGEPTQ